MPLFFIARKSFRKGEPARAFGRRAEGEAPKHRGTGGRLGRAAEACFFGPEGEDSERDYEGALQAVWTVF